MRLRSALFGATTAGGGGRTFASWRPPRTPRILELDALRGLAAAVILVFHLRYVYRHPALGTAVDLFFVLSGYLIATILIAQRGRPGAMARFYVRRSLRIQPIYYLALALAMGASILMASPPSLRAWPWFAAYLQNTSRYLGHAPEPFIAWFDHSWTLAIEEQFYVVWPWLVLALGSRRLAWVCLVFLPLPVLMRAQGMAEVLLLTRCDGLLLGALLAVALPRAIASNRARLWLPLAISLALVAGVSSLAMWPAGRWTEPPAGAGRGVPSWAYALRYLLASLGFSGLVALAAWQAGRPWMAALRLRPLVGLGTISYGLYLYHPILFGLINELIVRPGHLTARQAEPIKLGLTLTAALASWLLIERPLIRWRDRLAIARPHTAPDELADSPTRRTHRVDEPTRLEPHRPRVRTTEPAQHRSAS